MVYLIFTALVLMSPTRVLRLVVCYANNTIMSNLKFSKIKSNATCRSRVRNHFSDTYSEMSLMVLQSNDQCGKTVSSNNL